MLVSQSGPSRLFGLCRCERENKETFAGGAGARESTLADKRKRRMEIRIKRKKRAKRKVEAGFKKIITHSGGRRKVKFIKPTE